jgi:hypothetical protein
MLSILKKDDGYYLNIEGMRSALIYLGEHGPIVMKSIEEEHNRQMSQPSEEVCPECGEPYSGACGHCSVGHCQG